jgi:hypothetical protein
MPESVIRPVIEYPGFQELIAVETIHDEALRGAFERWMK